MSTITTHVLDTAQGRPAAGIEIVLERMGEQGEWQPVGRGMTDADGRLATLVPERQSAPPGVYRLTFATGAYFSSRQIAAFYPLVAVTFDVRPGDAHYHVPLLLSPFGYSTYRGS
jgi:5-hydroxyisourate hydrolase